MSYPHDDDLADAIALTEIILDDEPVQVTGAKLAALFSNMDRYAVTIALAKLLAELVELNDAGQELVCRQCFRPWAEQAGRSA